MPSSARSANGGPQLGRRDHGLEAEADPQLAKRSHASRDSCAFDLDRGRAAGDESPHLVGQGKHLHEARLPLVPAVAALVAATTSSEETPAGLLERQSE